MKRFDLTLYHRHPTYAVTTIQNLRLGDVRRKAGEVTQDLAKLAMVDDLINSWRKSIKRNESCEAIGLDSSNPDFACEIRRVQ